MKSSQTGMCLIAVIFDGLVCYLSKGIDLYGDTDQDDPVKVAQQKDTDVNNVNNIQNKNSAAS